MKRILISILILAGSLLAQNSPIIGGLPDSGPTLPPTCQIGQIYFKTTATVGLNQCSAVNTWSALGTGSGTVTSVSGTTNQITSTGGATPVLALAAPLTMPGDTIFTQAANGDDMLFGKRNTDTGPTGNLINFQTQASAMLFRVSVNGSLSLNKGIGTINNVATTGNPGVASTYGNVSLTGQVASITTSTLCATTCPTGQYNINAYLDSTVTCATPGTASIALTLTWTDETGTKSAITVPLDVNGGLTLGGTMALGNTTNSANGETSIWSVTGNAIQYATTYVGCTSGTGTYAIRLVASQVQ